MGRFDFEKGGGRRWMFVRRSFDFGKGGRRWWTVPEVMVGQVV